jgi:16S rRNA processing protein RimM
MEYMKIGKIVNTFGLKGELKVKSYTDFNEERFAKGNIIFVKYNDLYLEFIIDSYRVHKNSVLISFLDKKDINLVEKYKTFDVFCDKANLHELDEDEYYFFELVGMDVSSDEGEYIGKVSEVIEGKAHNLLRIKRDNDETVLIPYIDNFIVNVDEENKKIVIHLIEGLI